MANIVQQAGKVVTSATTGSAVAILPRSGFLLGFWANATGTLTLYDNATATALPSALISITACAVGWNPLPIELQSGLVANQSAQLYFVVA